MSDRVASDIVENVFFRYVLCPSSYDHHQFRFIIQLLSIAGLNDLVERASQSRSGLHKGQGFVW